MLFAHAVAKDIGKQAWRKQFTCGPASRTWSICVHKHAKLAGSGGMLPQKNFVINLITSGIASDGF